MALADLMARPLPFEFEGKVYLVAKRDIDIMLAFQRELELRAYLGIQRRRSVMDPGDYQQELAGLRSDTAAGVYEWGELASWKWFFTESGHKTVLRFKLEKGAVEQARTPSLEPPPAIDGTLIDRIFANAAKRKELIVLMMTQDFPPEPPAEQASGAPAA